MQHTHMNFLLMLFGGIIVDDVPPKHTWSKFIENAEDGNKKGFSYLALQLPQDHDNSMLHFYRLFQAMFIAFVHGQEIVFDR